MSSLLSIGHNVSACRWVHPQPPKSKHERGKQFAVAEAVPHKPTRQSYNNNDVGASTSANGSTWTWVPVPVASTVTTTQRVPVSAISTHAPTSLAPASMAIPA